MSRDVRREGGLWLLAGFALAHVALFGIVFQTVYRLGYSDIPIYYADADRIAHGLVPYRDFVLEYPPLAAVVFSIPRIFGTGLAAYYRAFTVELIACDLAILFVLYRIARDRGDRPAVVLGLYTAFTLALGPIISQEFDLAPAAITIVALWLATRRRDVGAWILIALGVLTKLYPLLLAPLFVLDALHERRWQRLARALATGATTVLVVMLPLLVTAPTAIRSFFAYHAKRGIQVESTYGGLLLAIDKLRLATVGMASSYGSWNITGVWLGPVIALSTLALIGAVGAAYWFLLRTPLAAEERSHESAWLSTACVLVLLAGIVTSKVLSPQYLVWVLPFVPLIRGPLARSIWALYALIGVATFYIFPANYDRLIFADDGRVITLLVLRNVLLLGLTLLVAWALRPAAAGAARARDAELA